MHVIYLFYIYFIILFRVICIHPNDLRWSRETLKLLKGSTVEHIATAFCSLRKFPFCTAIWLMSMRRLKICPTGCLVDAWALAISPKSLTAIPPSPPSDSATKGTNDV